MSAVAETSRPKCPPLVFTDSAAARVADLIAEKATLSSSCACLCRGGGGCSGFQYGFTFDEITNDDDRHDQEWCLVADRRHELPNTLVGAEIDYKEDLQGAQFVIKNPNATSTCGCGSSFSTPGLGPTPDNPAHGRLWRRCFLEGLWARRGWSGGPAGAKAVASTCNGGRPRSGSTAPPGGQ